MEPHLEKKMGFISQRRQGSIFPYDVMPWLQTKSLPMVEGEWLPPGTTLDGTSKTRAHL